MSKIDFMDAKYLNRHIYNILFLLTLLKETYFDHKVKQKSQLYKYESTLFIDITKFNHYLNT